ncbi:MAG: hypothetical protein R2682_07280 [Pyrinomonadaceae bacterium]
MRSIGGLKLYGVVAVAVLLVGCSLGKPAPPANEAAIRISPVSVQEGKDAQVRNGGWMIPLPENREQIRQSFSDAESEDGKPVKIAITDLVPKDVFFFTQTPSDAASPNSLLSGLLKLELIQELRVRAKTYCYLIYARRTKTDEQTGKPSPIGQMFVYRILDKDGDGKFETLSADDSRALVPEWAAK